MKEQLAATERNPLRGRPLPVSGLDTDTAAIGDILESATRLRSALRFDGRDPGQIEGTTNRIVDALRERDEGDRLWQAGAMPPAWLHFLSPSRAKKAVARFSMSRSCRMISFSRRRRFNSAALSACGASPGISINRS